MTSIMRGYARAILVFLLAPALHAENVLAGENLVITQPWIRATPVSARVVGRYLTIKNKGSNRWPAFINATAICTAAVEFAEPSFSLPSTTTCAKPG
jgi:copper(I)-binding protein